MTSTQLQLNSELFSALQVISEDENLMKKAVKALKRIAKNKQTMDETEYIMSSPAMVEIIQQGEEEVKRGDFKPIAIEDLWN